MRQIQSVAESYTAIEFTTGTTARAVDSTMGLPEARRQLGGAGSTEHDYLQAAAVLRSHFEARESSPTTPDAAAVSALAEPAVELPTNEEEEEVQKSEQILAQHFSTRKVS